MDQRGLTNPHRGTPVFAHTVLLEPSGASMMLGLVGGQVTLSAIRRNDRCSRLSGSPRSSKPRLILSRQDKSIG